MSLAVSTAKAEITPQPGHPMAGYGAQSAVRVATGTNSALWARAVVFWDSGYPNVLVSLDVLGVGAWLNAEVRQALAADGLPDTDLMLLASHTHNGPALPDGLHPYIAYGITDTTAIDAYGDWLRDTIVQLVRDAMAGTRTAVTLDHKVISQSWSYNRAGLAYAETAVPVLVARASGSPVAVLFGYGCHPVSAGNQQEWDGDYPGFAATAIEAAHPGATALFMPGPAGDQDPSGAKNWARRDALGAQLGAAVATAAATPGRAIAGPFSNRYSQVVLPLDVTPTASNMAAVRAKYVARKNNGALYPWYRRHAEIMIQQIDGDDYETGVYVSLQTWKLAGSPALRICMVGGELVSGYAAYFRPKWSGTTGLWIGGYANGCTCYLPSNELLPPIRSGGSYEGGWDVDYPSIAGGSQTVYGWIGHPRAGTGSNSFEPKLIAAITAQLT